VGIDAQNSRWVAEHFYDAIYDCFAAMISAASMHVEDYFAHA
jgi:Mg2+ and Co2+ transporter CorA